MKPTPSLLCADPLLRLRHRLLRLWLRGRSRPRPVVAGLFCGPAPDAALLARLHAQGVRQIVDLRAVSEATRQEAQRCAALGLEYVSVPTGEALPDFPTLQRLLARLLTARPGEGLYLHCDTGRNRAGAIVALYRLAIQGWSVRQAGRELLRHGFDPHCETLAEDVVLYAHALLRERPRSRVGVVATA
jgi:tyrosine-protein phosphatase SIW14